MLRLPRRRWLQVAAGAGLSIFAVMAAWAAVGQLGSPSEVPSAEASASPFASASPSPSPSPRPSPSPSPRPSPSAVMTPEPQPAVEAEPEPEPAPPERHGYTTTEEVCAATLALTEWTARHPGEEMDPWPAPQLSRGNNLDCMASLQSGPLSVYVLARFTFDSATTCTGGTADVQSPSTSLPNSHGLERCVRFAGNVSVFEATTSDYPWALVFTEAELVGLLDDVESLMPDAQWVTGQ